MAKDPTQALFDAGRIVEVELEMSSGDWDALRSQTRTLFSVLGPDCLGGPVASPYTWFRAAVRVDGTRVEPVGVRKRGLLGSLSRKRPSLRIKFNHFLKEQRLSGIERMTLNNAQQDPARVRQCLSYALFRAAGVPAPRCSFAHVTVNGEDLGLYVHVETIKKQFLRRHFKDDRGNLYAGTLSDFRPGWLNTFERNISRKQPVASFDRSDLEAVTAALQLEDARLVQALEPLVHLDSFLTFWAVEVLVGHHDGYAGNTNNFYVYADPGEGKRFRFIPWGVDQTFGSLPSNNPMPPAVFAHGFLARRLYLLPETRRAYLQRLRSLIDRIWDENALLAEVARMETLIRPRITSGVHEFDDSLAEVQRFIQNRRADLLADPEPLWPFAARNPPCARTVGAIVARLSTAWGTLAASDPFATGAGTLDLASGGQSLHLASVGGDAGDPTGGNEPGEALVRLVARKADGTLLFLLITMPANLLVPAATWPVDGVAVLSWFGAYDPTGTDPPSLLGLIGDGTLAITHAATVDAAPIDLSISGTLYEIGF